MGEVNLLDAYPRSKRPIAQRQAAIPAQRDIARQFGREYFDGDRTQGYGGYRYDGRWISIAQRMREFYRLQPGDRILDVGCAKGFLLHDLLQVVPGVHVRGLDVSRYALEHSMDDVRPRVVQGTADALPFGDDSFDLVVSINTIHNLDAGRCESALREFERVSRRFKYVQVDSWLTAEQRDNFERWVLTAQTYFAPDGWRRFFAAAGYTGDYYWTITE
jgi:cyclopropane fatty-acyl-phospholipid synthase-like methyltransferase